MDISYWSAVIVDTLPMGSLTNNGVPKCSTRFEVFRLITGTPKCLHYFNKKRESLSIIKYSGLSR